MPPLTNLEVETCLQEQNGLISRFCTNDTIYCFSDKNRCSYSKKLSEIENIDLPIEDDRDRFFQTISEKYPHLVGGICLEIGVRYGENAKRIANHLKPSMFYLVDPWLARGKYAADGMLPQNVYNIAYEKVKKELGSKWFVKIIKDFSMNVLNQFDDGSLDMIYIDGDHSYPEAKDDFCMYLPKLKSGGFFGGHDFTNDRREMELKGFGVQKCVTEFLIENDYKIEIATLNNYTNFKDVVLMKDWGFIKR
jgi:hypothetical protein